jgi:SNF2 family DNA or RNA helicase
MFRYYGSIKFDSKNNRWTIEHIEPHVSIKLKSIFTKIAKWKTVPIHFENTQENCRELEWFLSRYPLEMSEEDHNYLLSQKFNHLKKLEDLEKILKPDYNPRTFPLKGELRPYQATAVEIFLRNRRLLIGDGVGLGKTLCGIASALETSTLPMAVVVQTHLPTQWKEQFEKFTDLRVHLVKGTKPYNLPTADIYIWKYSCLSGWVDFFKMKFLKSVVFDECQELRISGSQKYEGAKVLTSNVDYVLGLSATPIYNYGDEIYNIMNLIKEGCLGNIYDFMREWAGGGNGKQIKNPKALGTYLRENFLFIRRTREDVQRELPPVNKIVHTVDFDKEAVEGIEEIAKKLAISVTTGTFVERGKAARELDIMVRQATGVSKAKYVAEYVKILLENGESVLLAGWHRAVYDIWLKELSQYNPVMYTGSENVKEKDEAKKAFIEGKSKLMIISLRSGIGLDGLQEKSSLVVFGELDYSPAVHEQVIGRLDRDGQKNQVTSIYLISDSGSDPLMVDLLGLKASQAKDIIDPMNNQVTFQNSDDTRIKLLAELYLKKAGNNG